MASIVPEYVIAHDLFHTGIGPTGEFEARWTLDLPPQLGGLRGLQADKLLIRLADSVQDLAGNALEGESTTNSFPSGDGKSGNAFEIRVDVLPGDVVPSGVVLGDDVLTVRDAQFTIPGLGSYTAAKDINGDGVILGDDVLAVRNRQFTLLPAGEPMVPSSTSASSIDVLDAAETTAPAIIIVGEQPVDLLGRASAFSLDTRRGSSQSSVSGKRSHETTDGELGVAQDNQGRRAIASTAKIYTRPTTSHTGLRHTHSLTRFQRGETAHPRKAGIDLRGAPDIFAKVARGSTFNHPDASLLAAAWLHGARHQRVGGSKSPTRGFRSTIQLFNDRMNGHQSALVIGDDLSQVDLLSV